MSQSISRYVFLSYFILFLFFFHVFGLCTTCSLLFHVCCSSAFWFKEQTQLHQRSFQHFWAVGWHSFSLFNFNFVAPGLSYPLICLVWQFFHLLTYISWINLPDLWWSDGASSLPRGATANLTTCITFDVLSSIPRPECSPPHRRSPSIHRIAGFSGPDPQLSDLVQIHCRVQSMDHAKIEQFFRHVWPWVLRPKEEA